MEKGNDKTYLCGRSPAFGVFFDETDSDAGDAGVVGKVS